jgi:hypothetical protein
MTPLIIYLGTLCRSCARQSQFQRNNRDGEAPAVDALVALGVGSCAEEDPQRVVIIADIMDIET